jgi:hexokinase
MDILEKAEAFLFDIGMHPEQTDIERTAGAFRAQMDAGLRGEPGGLPMLPTFLRAVGQVPDAEPVLVADAGGSNLRRALVSFHHGQPLVSERDSMPMPGSREEIGWDEFLASVAAFLLPLAGRSHCIA